jgi:hypothetical protein
VTPAAEVDYLSLVLAVAAGYMDVPHLPVDLTKHIVAG